MQTVARNGRPQEWALSDPQWRSDPEWVVGECAVCRLLIFWDDLTAYDVWDRLIHDECRAAFLREVSGAAGRGGADDGSRRESSRAG